MKAILALLLGVAYSASWDKEFTTEEFKAADAKQLFSDWSKHFERDYGTLQEEAYRFGLWHVAMKKITEVNDMDLTYKLRMNQFGDLTKDER